MQFPPYTTGTVSIANGDTTLVFTGGVINDVVARRGDVIYLDNENPGVEIFERTDTTHCEIAVPWSGGDKVNVPFTLVPNFPARVAGAEAAEDVTRLVAALNTNGLPWLVPTDRIDPDPSWGDEGQTAIQPATGKQWHKEGGVWVYDGIFRPLAPKGAWDPETQYGVADIVSTGDASYIAVAPSLNKLPPDPDYWMVNGSRGDAGEIAIGTVTTGASGSPAAIVNVGTGTSAILEFTLPRGDKGDSGEISIGLVASGDPGTGASVVNAGTPTDAVLNFVIPRGDQGVGIQPDATGNAADKAAHDAEPKDFVFLRTDVLPFQLWVKASNASGDWAGPTFIGGEMAIGDWGGITVPATETFDFGGLS